MQTKYGAVPQEWQVGERWTEQESLRLTKAVDNIASQETDKKSPDDKAYAQLVEFYRHHDPSKIPEVPSLLNDYPREDLIASLMSKYGTLPEGWESSSRNAFFTLRLT